MLTADGYVVGIEIGARGCRVGLADLQGKLIDQQQSPLPPAAPDATIAEIGHLFETCLAQSGLSREKLVRAGCGFTGPVDATRGVVLSSPRLAGWENVPLGSLLEERLDLPTLVDNDARVAALGEARFGAGRGEQHLAYVHLGVGLGGGLVLDGRLYRGATATAGEIGHLLVNEDGPLCSCGKPGHLEAYASGSAIVQRALELAQQRGPGGALLGRVAAGESPTPVLVFEAARDGDAAALQVTTDAVRYLAIAIANLVTTVNPAVIVVGGRVAEAGPLLFEPLHARVRRYAMAVPARAVRIVPATLRSDGILIGAIALAVQSLDWS